MALGQKEKPKLGTRTGLGRFIFPLTKPGSVFWGTWYFSPGEDVQRGKSMQLALQRQELPGEGIVGGFRR